MSLCIDSCTWLLLLLTLNVSVGRCLNKGNANIETNRILRCLKMRRLYFALYKNVAVNRSICQSS